MVSIFNLSPKVYKARKSQSELCHGIMIFAKKYFILIILTSKGFTKVIHWQSFWAKMSLDPWVMQHK
jgi:hypothetical protein